MAPGDVLLHLVEEGYRVIFEGDDLGDVVAASSMGGHAPCSHGSNPAGSELGPQ